jgi:hypothetical protein
MKDWYTSIYKACIIASAISFLISIFSSGTVSYGSMLSGYSLLILSVMMILLILINPILNISQGNNGFQYIYSLLFATGPFLFMLGVIGFIMYLIIHYQDIINTGNVSNSYSIFSNIAILLFLVQIYIVYTNLSTGNKISMVSTSFMYLINVFTMICSLILFTILKYFTTDGFT